MGGGFLVKVLVEFLFLSFASERGQAKRGRRGRRGRRHGGKVEGWGGQQETRETEGKKKYALPLIFLVGHV